VTGFDFFPVSDSPTEKFHPTLHDAYILSCGRVPPPGPPLSPSRSSTQLAHAMRYDSSWDPELTYHILNSSAPDVSDSTPMNTSHFTDPIETTLVNPDVSSVTQGRPLSLSSAVPHRPIIRSAKKTLVRFTEPVSDSLLKPQHPVPAYFNAAGLRGSPSQVHTAPVSPHEVSIPTKKRKVSVSESLSLPPTLKKSKTLQIPQRVSSGVSAHRSRVVAVKNLGAARKHHFDPDVFYVCLEKAQEYSGILPDIKVTQDPHPAPPRRAESVKHTM
jgi:hypothetical protein